MSASEDNKAGVSVRQKIFTIVGATLLVVAIIIGVVMMKTKPKAGRRPARRIIPVVEVAPLNLTKATVILEEAGTVIPVDEISLQAQVGGQIVWVHSNLVAGGLIKADELLIQIDERDYQLQLAQAEAALDRAESELKLEKGRQDVAESEWTLLGDEKSSRKDRELALRKPQLKTAKAAVASAKAAVEKAELDLERTKIISPVDGIISLAETDAGERASVGQMLAKVVWGDVFWVRAAVAVDEIRWLNIPGSEADIVLSSGEARKGKVVKLLPELEPGGRMAQVLIEVKNPMYDEDGLLRSPPLLIGAFVRAVIQGNEIDHVYDVSLNALRDGNELWVLDDTNHLHIMPVDVVWMGRERVYVQSSGNNNFRLITSGLATPVAGMELRVAGEGESKSGKQEASQGKKKRPAEEKPND